LSPAQCAEIRISGTQFEIEQDFNRDGKVDLAQTGVAQKRDGTDVGVVVISERDNPRKNQVLEVSANGLLVLTYYAETLVAYSCIECDVGYHIVWNASTRRYQLRDSTDND
jgi:hypothetical protein